MLNEVRVARAWLIFIALLIGVVVVAAEHVLFNSLSGRSKPFENYVQLVNAIGVALPFLCLALAGARRLLPWLVGLALTLALWGYFLYSVIYQRDRVVGVDMGMALIMFLSPLFISPIVLGVHALQRRAAALR